ncbi:MAG TPA: dienelactone hydrolase family protein [Thermoanaerobaculia bacterium]
MGWLTVLVPTDGTYGPAISTSEAPVEVLDRPWIAGCGSGCENGYLELARRHADHGEPVDGPSLKQALAAARAIPEVRRLDLGRSELRARIVDELKIGFLLESVGCPGFAVATLRETRVEGLTRSKLLFWDPFVGSFEGTLLVPDGAASSPAVLGLHGHRDDDRVFAREYMGEQLAREGYVVLIPRLRAHDCSLKENRIARQLLRSGFTLMGLRVYEALRMLDYLRSLEEVDDERIGLLSHSGGSSAANLLVRVTDGVAAQVTDYETDYRDACGPLSVHCETVPGLVPLSANVNDRRDLPLPWLRVSYKFLAPAERCAILAFFDEHLRPRPSPGRY